MRPLKALKGLREISFPMKNMVLEPWFFIGGNLPVKTMFFILILCFKMLAFLAIISFICSQNLFTCQIHLVVVFLVEGPGRKAFDSCHSKDLSSLTMNIANPYDPFWSVTSAL